MSKHTLSSSRPYLIRGLYEWIVDNGVTPHLLVDTAQDNVVVPVDFIEDDKIVLNISPMAAHNLELGNEQITFSARFSGVSMSVVVPVKAVLAIYARENGEGMVFNGPSGSEPDSPGPNRPAPAPTKINSPKDKKPSLKIVK